MQNSLIYLLALVFLGSLAGLVGGFAYFLTGKISNFICRYSTAFASGVLLTVSLLDLLPEAHEMLDGQAFVVILVAFLLSFIFEEGFAKLYHSYQDNSGPTTAAISLVLIGDTIHNFIDGVAIAAAFFVNPSLGLVVAVSSFLHETPHEIGDFGVLLAGGYSKMQALLLNALSACFTLVGAFFVFVMGRENETLIGVLLAIAAGMFLYLAASDFLPKHTSDKKDAFFKITAVLVGVVLMYMVTASGQHGHS